MKKWIEDEKEIAGIRRGRAFWIGLSIAVTSGVLSALLNVGFVHARPVAERVVEVYQYRMPGKAGADGIATVETIARNSSLAAWVVVLAGAFVMNAGSDSPPSCISLACCPGPSKSTVLEVRHRNDPRPQRPSSGQPSFLPRASKTSESECHRSACFEPRIL